MLVEAAVAAVVAAGAVVAAELIAAAGAVAEVPDMPRPKEAAVIHAAAAVAAVHAALR